MSDRDTDIDYLAKTIFGEARGESEEGQRAVGYAIMNRLRRGSWGSSIQKVVMSRDQFECWKSGRIDIPSIEQDVYNRIRVLATHIYDGEADNPIGNRIYFNNPTTDNNGIEPGWVTNITRHGFKDIGSHRFYNYDGN